MTTKALLAKILGISMFGYLVGIALTPCKLLFDGVVRHNTLSDFGGLGRVFSHENTVKIENDML